MGLIPIILAVAVIFLPIYLLGKLRTPDEWASYFVFCLTTLFLAGTFYILIVQGLTYFHVLGGEEYYSIEIVSLDTELSLHGSFVLGSGQINSSSYYYYYVLRKDGGLRRCCVKTHRAIIYEGLGEGTPRLKWTQWVYRPGWLTKLPYFTEICVDPEDYYLIVPENTVIREFNAR